MLKNNLDKLITRSGYKKKYIADKLEVSQTVLSRWVSGKSKPSLLNTFKLAYLLDCKVDDLFEYKPD